MMRARPSSRKNRKASGWNLVKKDTKGNQVVNKGGKQIYQSKGNILGLGGVEERGRDHTRVKT
jgi:hypothetical protein